MARNSSFIRFFAVLDFEATCWDGQQAGAQAKQSAELEIIEFPTVLYRVNGDVLDKIGEFRRYKRKNLTSTFQTPYHRYFRPRTPCIQILTPQL